LRKVKLDQRKLTDNVNTLVDLAKTQTNVYETVCELNVNQTNVESRLKEVEDKLVNLQNKLNVIPLQIQSIIIEQNRFIAEKFQYLQKQTSQSNSNSIDNQDTTNSSSNALQIPTLSAANNKNNR